MIYGNIKPGRLVQMLAPAERSACLAIPVALLRRVAMSRQNSSLISTTFQATRTQSRLTVRSDNLVVERGELG